MHCSLLALRAHHIIILPPPRPTTPSLNHPHRNQHRARAQGQRGNIRSKNKQMSASHHGHDESTGASSSSSSTTNSTNSSSRRRGSLSDEVPPPARSSFSAPSAAVFQDAMSWGRREGGGDRPCHLFYAYEDDVRRRRGGREGGREGGRAGVVMPCFCTRVLDVNEGGRGGKEGGRETSKGTSYAGRV